MTENANVVLFPGTKEISVSPRNDGSRADEPAEDVLRECMRDGMDEVVVVGFDKDGCFYFNSNLSGAGDAIYHLTRAIHKLHRLIDEQTEGD